MSGTKSTTSHPLPSQQQPPQSQPSRKNSNNNLPAAPAPSPGAATNIRRVKYTGSEGFEQSELAARRALAERDSTRLAQRPEEEPEGIDAYIPDVIPGSRASVETVMQGGKSVPVSAAVQGVQTANRVLGGYDLVRVGNFSEKIGEVPDIAFFHNRSTLGQIYQEERYGRQRLVQQCCGALRDVCDNVFNVDAARVTLFYEPGAVSRFVMQRLIFNIAEVEARARARKLDDVRTDVFVYVHFYGLLVHKLAHFFDAVHGTRHDFFMSEYRALYSADFAALLAEKGLDPAAAARDYPGKLWEVVN